MLKIKLIIRYRDSSSYYSSYSFIIIKKIIKKRYKEL